MLFLGATVYGSILKVIIYGRILKSTGSGSIFSALENISVLALSLEDGKV